jgi:acetyltransferase-like isoleucine patch superfamily enzyme
MSDLRSSDLAPGLVLGPDVSLGDDLDLGAHVVIHSGVTIGAGCTLQDGAIVGKRPQLGSRSRAEGPIGPTVLERGVTVCCYGLVFAGAYVRERAIVGPDTVLGAGSAVGIDVRVGARVKILNNVSLAPRTVVEDDVHLTANVVTTTRRWEPGGKPGSVVLRRGCRIGIGAVLLAGVEVGEEAVVGAGSVVSEDVAPRTVVAGTPARLLREGGADDR